jgi:Amt family ammonium transporter
MNGLWNPTAKITAIDFAGGTVVHMTSGWSALVLCILLGHRLGFRKEILAPHSMVLCMVGTGLLWVGWYGFNAGSALAPDGIAANAFMTTTLATAVASFTWAMLEYMLRGKPSVLGFCSGAVGGLVVITPACGYVDSTGAIGIGFAAGIVPFFACTKLKSWFGYDDALDTFGIHAVGGTLGAFLTGVLATASVNPNLSLSGTMPFSPATQNGLARIVGHSLWFEQLKAIAVTIVVAVVGSVIIGAIVRGMIGLRIAPEIERQGLDINEHGEEGYMAAG